MVRTIASLIDRWHWLILALTAPFFLFPAPNRILALGVLPGLWLLAWWLRRKPPLTPTPLNLALLLLTVMLLVSLWATPDMTLSLPKISGLVLGLGIFFAVSREAPRLGWSVALFLAFGLGIALLGLFGTNWFTEKIALFDTFSLRLPAFIRGLQGAESGFHPNEVAGALLWVLPLLFTLSLAALAARPQKPRQIGLLAAFLLGTAFVTLVFLLSQSRGAYLGLALTLLLLLLIALRPAPRRLALAALTLLALTLSARWRDLPGWLSTSGASANSALSLASLASRLEIWSRALDGIQDFPLTGMGLNAFRVVARAYYPFYQIPLNFEFGHAHNEFLQAALDLGLPGLIAFLALYILAFWMLADVWRALRRLPENFIYPPIFAGHGVLFMRALSLGLFGGLLAHLLYGLTDAVALGAKPGFLFWMALGLVAGLHQRTLAALPEDSHD